MRCISCGNILAEKEHHYTISGAVICSACTDARVGMWLQCHVCGKYFRANSIHHRKAHNVRNAKNTISVSVRLVCNLCWPKERRKCPKCQKYQSKTIFTKNPRICDICSLEEEMMVMQNPRVTKREAEAFASRTLRKGDS